MCVLNRYYITSLSRISTEYNGAIEHGNNTCICSRNKFYAQTPKALLKRESKMPLTETRT
jgi:hypothetical protein